ncbi:MAG: hypothetical protein GF416_04725 [Candidatus Altiarchaeales archaeon]|nr:hypothetical protein [Candidatus Altiarchaeales archaeon]MBD3416424.1 hypothetical protein [Candidatus Altiarchaeales archaeon]
MKDLRYLTGVLAILLLSAAFFALNTGADETPQLPQQVDEKAHDCLDFIDSDGDGVCDKEGTCLKHNSEGGCGNCDRHKYEGSEVGCSFGRKEGKVGGCTGVCGKHAGKDHLPCGRKSVFS